MLPSTFSAGIKVNDGENVRMTGVDQKGYRAAFIVRKSLHLEGNAFNAADPSYPEGDVNTLQCPDPSFRPAVSIQLCNYGPSKGTRLSHKTVVNGDIDNYAEVAQCKRTGTNAFLITLKNAFPEANPDGQPLQEILIWGMANPSGVVLDNQGFNWTFACTATADPLVYTATLSDLGDQDWQDGYKPEINDIGTGGMAAGCSWRQGEHADGLLQVNDGYSVSSVVVDRVDVKGAYQTLGNTGTPAAGAASALWTFTRTHAQQVVLAPQQPKSLALYVKGDTRVTWGYGCTMIGLNGRPISDIAMYPSQVGTVYDTSGAAPTLTYAAGQAFSGMITQKIPTTPNAPLTEVGTNYKVKGAAGHIGWINYTAPTTAGILQDISLEAPPAGAPADAIAVIRVACSAPGEIIDTTLVTGTDILTKVRKRLSRKAGAPSGTSTIRVRATIRGTSLFIERDLSITLP